MTLNIKKPIVLLFLLAMLFVVVACSIKYIAIPMRKAHEEEQSRQRLLSAQLACYSFWQARSAIADAEYEFGKGRTGLLQIVEGGDWIELVTPGLRAGAKADIRRDYPPFAASRLQEISGKISILSNHFSHCDSSSYAWDFNVTMLRLLGRRDDVVLRQVSPELDTSRLIRSKAH